MPVCGVHEFRCPWSSEQGVRSSEIEVKDGSMEADIGARGPTKVFYKSSNSLNC